VNDKQINKLIGQGVMVLIAYYVVSAFVDYIELAIVSLVCFRLYQEHQRRR
jgi:hypothetical protein